MSNCSFVMLNYETQLTRSNRKHIQAPLAAAIRSISDLGAQLTASWSELYLGDSPPHRHLPTPIDKCVGSFKSPDRMSRD